jgi:hypothetical protein
MRISCSRDGRASNVCMVLVCRYRRCGVAPSWHVQTVMRSPRVSAFSSYQLGRTRLQNSSPQIRRSFRDPRVFHCTHTSYGNPHNLKI